MQNGASGVTGSNAFISQGVNGATDRDQATITQTGTVANALVRQGGSSFGGGGSYSSGDQAAITQSGKGVIASITQNGRTVGGTSESNGRDNNATITQGASVVGNAAVTPVGGSNVFTINGGATGAAVINQGTTDGSGDILQTNRNTATINQTSTGTGNAATILQFAGSNADGVGQFGNMATISQVAGSSNVAFVQQGIQGSATSSNDNVASITQNGSGNFARFLQVGNSNMVNITQNGYNNRLTLVQEGGNTGVTFRYTQIGNNNTQVVNQHF